MIETDLTRDRIRENAWDQDIFCKQIALPRHGTPKDVAGVAALLCLITGQIFAVDGAWLEARYWPVESDMPDEQ